MLPEEIIGSLKSLTTKHGYKISEIERDCLVPKNSLASVITGKRAFPLKHKERLQEYCKAKEIAILLGSPPIETLDGKSWTVRVEAWCKEKGFQPAELIEKYDGLERRLKYYAESKFELEQELGTLLDKGQNKPDTALEIKNEGQSTSKEKKGQEKAENGPKTNEKGWVIRETAKMPDGLTPLQQDLWRVKQKNLKY